MKTNMHKYFDNILFYLQRSGGGSVYWGELVKRFNNEQLVQFIQPNLTTDNIVLNNLWLRPIIKEKNVPLGILRYLPLTCKLQENSIFHSSYYRYSDQKGISNVVTVHDFIYEYYVRGIAGFIHNKQKHLAVKKAKGIICISNSTKVDLVRFFPDAIKNKHIAVIYNGVSDEFRVLKNKFSSLLNGFENDKYILFIGHRSKYKNFDFAIQVVKKLPWFYKLLVVGNALNEVETKSLNDHLPGRYVFAGSVSNEQLNELYNSSTCLLYPSSYEGFGIPVVEAFKTGCPVVAQDIPAVKEISQGGALLVNGLDVTGFRNSILSLEKDRIKSDLVSIGIINSAKFSWDKCFGEVNEFYNCI